MATYSAQNCWVTWSTTTTASVTTTASTSDTVWYTWSNAEAASNSSTDNSTWYAWSTDSITYSTRTITATYDSWEDWSYTQKTERQKKQRQRRQLRTEEPRRFAGELTDREKSELRRKKAEKKAKQLLLDLIGEDQLKVYEETGRLFVKGRKNDYIVQKQGFVQMIEKDKITDLCVHLAERHKLPLEDNVVALKLAIENEENKVLKLANCHGSRNRQAELPRAACM